MADEHTPGPWSADGPDRWEGWKVHAAAGVGGEIADICGVPRPDDDMHPGEVEANARLIAAAPGMKGELLASRLLLEVMKNSPDVPERFRRQCADQIAEIDDVLDRVDGVADAARGDGAGEG